MVYMYHSFPIHSSPDGHLGCFHVLAMINSVQADSSPLMPPEELTGIRQVTIYSVSLCPVLGLVLSQYMMIPGSCMVRL